jgi:inorganic triphosphatase YgiF
MSSTREVELKFACGKEDLAAVLAAAPPGDDDAAELISVYFDTPDLALQKAGASLRVRESQGRRVQTLKRGEGLAREEHEASIEGLAPDPELGPLPGLMPAGASLRPAFNVRVSRRQRLVRCAGAEIELALDQGEVVGGDASTPICEVELELKSGPAEALFTLARTLANAAPLYLSFDTKAARGQALAAGAAPGPRRSAAVVLGGGETAGEAFQAVARRALAQVAANAALLREDPTVEAVHQLRVGVRRFRSALSTFRPILGSDSWAALNAELTWLSHACDEARNLDVYAEGLASADAEVQGPAAGLASLRSLIDAECGRARAEVVRTVSSARFRGLMIDAAQWMEIGAWRLADPAGEPAERFAKDVLKKQRHKVLKLGKDVSAADDAALHHLRIAAKKLRYAGDAFGSLYGARRLEAFTSPVKDLQTELGELNDLATAAPLISGLALPHDAAFAAGKLLGLRAATRPKRIRRVARAVARLADARPYWNT